MAAAIGHEGDGSHHYFAVTKLFQELQSAAERGDVAVLNEMASKRSIPDSQKLQALKTCASKGHVEGVKALICSKDGVKVVVQHGVLPCVMALFDYLKETMYVPAQDAFEINFPPLCREILGGCGRHNRADVVSAIKGSDAAKLALRHLGNNCFDEPLCLAASCNNLEVFKELYPLVTITVRQQAYTSAIKSDKILQFLQTAPENGLDIYSILATLRQADSKQTAAIGQLLSRIDPTQSKIVFQFTPSQNK